MVTPPTKFRHDEARKLKDSEVRSIFESLHDNKPPPQGLNFQIVHVDSDGKRLSPPAHEFEDGLYVLLRPEKSNKGNVVCREQYEKPKIPPHLVHLKMESPLAKNCPWSLSGPQFPKPTAIQQRYCYPQEDSEYASKKGGSLWTMYNCEGVEDTEYRLLHIYYSEKREKNMAMKKSKRSHISSKTKNKREPKRTRPTVDVRKRTKKQKQSIWKLDHHSTLPDTIHLSSPHAIDNQILRQSHMKDSSNNESVLARCTRHDLLKCDSYEDSFDYEDVDLVFPPNHSLYYQRVEDFSSGYDQTQSHRVQSPSHPTHEFDSMLKSPLADSFSMMNKHATEWPCLGGSIDNEHINTCIHQRKVIHIEILMKKLNVAHRIINEWIGSRPRSEQRSLVHVVADWAKSISESPLDIVIPVKGEHERNDYTTETNLDLAVEV